MSTLKENNTFCNYYLSELDNCVGRAFKSYI